MAEEQSQTQEQEQEIIEDNSVYSVDTSNVTSTASEVIEVDDRSIEEKMKDYQNKQEQQSQQEGEENQNKNHNQNQSQENATQQEHNENEGEQGKSEEGQNGSEKENKNENENEWEQKEENTEGGDNGSQEVQVDENTLLSKLKEKIGEDVPFNSIEDVKNTINEYKEYKQQEESWKQLNLNEDEKAVLASYRKTGDPSAYNRYAQLDVDNIDPEQALWLKYKEDNPGKSEKFLQKKFQRDWKSKYENYKTEDGEEDLEEKEYAQLAFDEDVKEAKNYLKQKKEEFSNIGQELNVGNQEQEQQGGLTEEEENTWREKMNESLQNQEVDFDIGDGKKVKLSLNKDQKQKLEQYMSSPAEFFENHILKNGRIPDMEAAKRVYYLAEYGNDVFKEVYNAGVQAERDASIKKAKNSTQKSKGNTVQDNTLGQRQKYLDSVVEGLNL